ncbi:hypothetical protein [Leucobacter sp. GX24907]
MSEQRTTGAGAERAIVSVELWRIALVVLWIGLVAAISFIEAPLKFQAPGITIPLGLGIGRLVFTALNAVEGALLIALAVLAFLPNAARLTRARLTWLAALAVVFLIKVLAVRPPLNARTDLVLAGADPGQSPWHYVYIACDLATLVLLVIIAAGTGRAILRSVEP